MPDTPRRRPALGLVLAAALIGGAPTPLMADEAPLPARRVVLEDGFDRPGGDLQQLFNTSLQACASVCTADPTCTGLTYNARSRACFPKGAGAGPAQPFAGALSGQVITTPAPLMDAAAARAASASAWLREGDLKAAQEQAQSLGITYPGSGEDADTLRGRAAAAGSMGERRDVIRWIGAVAAMTDAPGDWLSLAQWMQAEAEDSGSDEAARTAMSAAVNAWLRDPGPGSLALRSWATLAERLDRGPAGMRALRQAAAADPDPALAEMLAGFESRHGLRVDDSRVEADAPAPRACVVMTENLAPGTDYRSFVALPDPALAVEAEGRQICVSGITHGQTLNLTLRKGLPAASGEVLGRDVAIRLYVRDRSPLARFSGRAYLLPAGGDQGLTVRTVNTDTVDLALYRMSDRNLVRSLRDDIFGQPLSDWKESTFTDEMGEQIWKGSANIAPTADGAPHKVNEEVSTRLDIARTAGPLAPGVYALTASVPGQSEDRSPPATQWFMISDLGLTSWSGNDGLTVAVRGLGNAAALPGIRVQLVSRGNAILGTVMTDDQGVARFDAGLARGRDAAAPAMLTAARMEGDTVADMAFLSLVEPEFDLSDRGVEGQPPAPPVNIFATTERGAYRAGETVHATILARNEAVAALPDLPLTAIILRPDGVEAARVLVPPAGDGGYVLDWDIPGSAPRGGWRIEVKLDPEAEALASMRVLVEDFRPERLDLTPDLPPAPLATTAPLPVALDARWLYGAPGAELPVEGELRLAPAETVPGWDGYRFGRADADPVREVITLDPGTTDEQGRWQTELPVPAALADARAPLDATFVLSVREGAGRPVERRETRLVMPRQPVIGIRPASEDGSVAENSEAEFRVVALGPDLKPVAGNTRWVLNRITTDYQWYAMDGNWSWEPVVSRARISEGDLALTPEGPAALAAPVQWGEYELVVSIPGGAESSIRFSAGWGSATGGSDTPDKLKVTLDKPAYRAGDTARLTLDAASDGTALISVMAGRLISLQAVPVKAGQNSVDLPVTAEWGAGAYVAASVIRPVAPGAGEAPAPAGSSHAPIRALGLAHAGVDPGPRRLEATLTAPAETTPRGTVQVRLAVKGAAPGASVHATIAAVDQGILNLTGFKSPDPTGHYFGQQRLGVGIRDLYGRLILPSGAADGAIRSGGSDAAPQQTAPPPTEQLMAWFSGPWTAGADGTIEASVPLPDFNGEVRLMAVVWSADAVGQAEATMLVRDPVVMTVTAPAFLAPGDRAEVGIALTHVSGPAGEVGLRAEGGTDGPALGLAGLPASVTLADKARGSAGLTITAPEGEGVARLRIVAALPGDSGSITKDLAISVTRQDPVVTRASRLTLAPGATQMLDPASSLGSFRPGTGTATLTSGAFAQLDLGAALLRLQTYPYGCTEQLASTAMPQLYLADLLPAISKTVPGGPLPQQDVDRSIAQILTRQTSSGAFGLWDAEPGDHWLDAFATDFLSRARASGHPVPEEAMRRALANLQNNLNSAGEPQYADASDNAALAYSAYVLARERSAVISDLRYYVDTAGDAFATPMAAAQLGAALAAYGDVGRADVMFNRAQQLLLRSFAKDDPSRRRGDYGTPLRDAAATLALATEAGTRVVDRASTATAVASLIASRQAEGAALSTQEAMWVALAGHALQAGPDAASGLTIAGAPTAGPLVALGDPASLGPLALANSSTEPLDVTLSVTAMPEQPPAASGTAWAISRRYFTPEGQPADPSTVAQGTRLVAVLEVTPLADSAGRLMITDPLPAGFEIDNPSLISSGELSGLDWLDATTSTQMTEFRQDRFAAAVDREQGDGAFTLAYRLRAVSPGDFAHPAATVEDMYRPERRGWTDSGRTQITR